AQPPPASRATQASPTCQPVTSAPTSATRPEHSRPRTSDAPGGGGYSPRRCIRSARFTPAAVTSTSTSSAAGTGVAVSAQTSASGPSPLLVSTRTALITLTLRSAASVVQPCRDIVGEDADQRRPGPGGQPQHQCLPG